MGADFFLHALYQYHIKVICFLFLSLDRVARSIFSKVGRRKEISSGELGELPELNLDVHFLNFSVSWMYHSVWEGGEVQHFQLLAMRYMTLVQYLTNHWVWQ